MQSAVLSWARIATFVKIPFVSHRTAASITRSDTVAPVLSSTFSTSRLKSNMNSTSANAKSPDDPGTESDNVVEERIDDVTPKPKLNLRPVKRWKGADVQKMSRQDLIDRIENLERSNENYRCVILKRDGEKVRKDRKTKRVFEFSQYNTRHVALKIAYLGWDYCGLAVSDQTPKTIEHELFDAFIRTKLIESRETANYSRCGRTDRGVSAWSQVISIDLRSNLLEGLGVKVRENGSAAGRKGDKTTEIDYLSFLNKVLPREIRVVAWCPVEVDFNARFSCTQRTYKYYFPEAGVDMNAMQRAAEHLYGVHDFRNFCKMDIKNGVTRFERRIHEVRVERLHEDVDGYGLCVITIAGSAFLWHQIRCIAAILFMVGKAREDPSIVLELLDIEKNPCRPQYEMATDMPLVLFDCEFPNIVWRYEEGAVQNTIYKLQNLWTEHTIKATIVRQMLNSIQRLQSQDTSLKQLDFQTQLELITGRAHIHKHLMERVKCDSLEDRVEQALKKQKLVHHPPSPKFD